MKTRRAFTLVELLVVIGIIAVLVGILLPALNAARRSANSLKCATALRQIGTCFKLYELDSKGYWPVARLSGWKDSGGNIKSYNIDGVDYPINTMNPPGQAYWFTFLAKYATRAKMGNASGTDSTAAADSRKTIFFGCPAWDGYMQGGINAGDTNVVQPGYGMNFFPTFSASYPKFASFPPETNSNRPLEVAVVDPVNENPTGNFLKAKVWCARGSERCLVTDSRFWGVQSGQPPFMSSYPPAVVAQPVLENSSNGVGGGSQSWVDMYRHGTFPKRIGVTYDPKGGKISYNILYCDGHVATATDGREAYKSLRMKFPG